MTRVESPEQTPKECGQMVRISANVARPCQLPAGHQGYHTRLTQEEIDARIDAVLFGRSREKSGEQP